MYGAAIETAFQHIEFEREQLRRKLEMRRLLEVEQQPQRSRRSLAAVFSRITPRFDVRIADRRSTVTPSQW